MIDYLSPREDEDVREAERNGRGWGRVIRLFLEGPRFLLGWDRAIAGDDIARLAGLDEEAAKAAIEEATRWAVRHGLHLLGWEESDGRRLYFMAVG